MKEKREKYVDMIRKKSFIGTDRDILGFLLDYGTYEDWQLDLINIVRDESHYFIPQIKTKILNEGWASFWHYKLLHELEVPQKFHIPFLKMHNAVVRPHIGGVNPYHLGFYIFQKIFQFHHKYQLNISLYLYVFSFFDYAHRLSF